MNVVSCRESFQLNLNNLALDVISTLDVTSTVYSIQHAVMDLAHLVCIQ